MGAPVSKGPGRDYTYIPLSTVDQSVKSEPKGDLYSQVVNSRENVTAVANKIFADQTVLIPHASQITRRITDITTSLHQKGQELIDERITFKRTLSYVWAAITYVFTGGALWNKLSKDDADFQRKINRISGVIEHLEKHLSERKLLIERTQEYVNKISNTKSLLNQLQDLILQRKYSVVLDIFRRAELDPAWENIIGRARIEARGNKLGNLLIDAVAGVAQPGVAKTESEAKIPPPTWQSINLIYQDQNAINHYNTLLTDPSARIARETLRAAAGKTYKQTLEASRAFLRDLTRFQWRFKIGEERAEISNSSKESRELQTIHAFQKLLQSERDDLETRSNRIIENLTCFLFQSALSTAVEMFLPNLLNTQQVEDSLWTQVIVEDNVIRIQTTLLQEVRHLANPEAPTRYALATVEQTIPKTALDHDDLGFRSGAVPDTFREVTFQVTVSAPIESVEDARAQQTEAQQRFLPPEALPSSSSSSSSAVR